MISSFFIKPLPLLEANLSNDMDPNLIIFINKKSLLNQAYFNNNIKNNVTNITNNINIVNNNNFNNLNNSLIPISKPITQKKIKNNNDKIQPLIMIDNKNNNNDNNEKRTIKKTYKKVVIDNQYVLLDEGIKVPISNVLKNKRWCCPFNSCNKAYKSKYTLRNHYTTHTTSGLKCHYCNKRFNSPSRRREHERTHTKEKPFKCNYCDKAYTQHHSLKDHVKCHLDQNQFQCQNCYKQLKTTSSFKAHQKKCTGS